MLTVILRTSAGVNKKPRPSWFSKVSCARSLRVAVEEAGARLIVVADRGIPDGTDSILGEGEIVSFIGGNNRRSFLRALSVALEVAEKDPSGHILFAEDDYLFRSDALVRLGEMLRGRDDLYFTLYSPDDTSWHQQHPSQPLRGVRQELVISADGHSSPWRAVTHATGSYGLSTRLLREDVRAIRSAMYSGGPFAHTTSATVQGIQPFSWRHMHRDLNLAPHPSAVKNSVARFAMRAVMNFHALNMQSRSRSLVAPAVDLAMHCENGHVRDPSSWESLSRALADD